MTIDPTRSPAVAPHAQSTGSATVQADELEPRLQALRLQGRREAARACLRDLLARVGEAPGAAATTPAGRWLQQLLAAHDERWWTRLEGRRCRLRRRGPEDLAFVRRLWAAPNFMARFNALAPPLPADDQALRQILAHEQAALSARSRSLHWVIEGCDGAAFGVASLADIQPAHRRAEFLVGVHEPPYAGAAAEATLLAADFAFGVLHLRKLVALVPVHNRASLEGAEHIGFRREGLLRAHVLHQGRPVDLVALALMADDPEAAVAQRRVRRRLLGAAGPAPGHAAGPAPVSAMPERPTTPGPTP